MTMYDDDDEHEVESLNDPKHYHQNYLQDPRGVTTVRKVKPMTTTARTRRQLQLLLLLHTPSTTGQSNVVTLADTSTSHGGVYEYQNRRSDWYWYWIGMGSATLPGRG
jgi:hypothetical protein